MTIHYLKNYHSLNSICGKSKEDIYRGNEECTSILEIINCEKCIIELEDMIRKLKNNNK